MPWPFFFALPGAVLLVLGLALITNWRDAADWYIDFNESSRARGFGRPLLATDRFRTTASGIVIALLGVVFLIAAVTG